MAEDLTEAAVTVAEWVLWPLCVVAAAGLAVWRFARRPKPWVGTVAPTAHRGPELGRLAIDHRKPRTIEAADLYRARKAQEDER